MTIIGDHWSMPPPEPSRTPPSRPVQRPAQAAEEAQGRFRSDGAERPSEPELHKADDLRKVVQRLVDSGDVQTPINGSVRPGRVEAARQNSADGAYNDRGVLAEIVDRLLDQWQI